MRRQCRVKAGKGESTNQQPARRLKRKKGQQTRQTLASCRIETKGRWSLRFEIFVEKGPFEIRIREYRALQFRSTKIRLP